MFFTEREATYYPLNYTRCMYSYYNLSYVRFWVDTLGFSTRSIMILAVPLPTSCWFVFFPDGLSSATFSFLNSQNFFDFSLVPSVLRARRFKHHSKLIGMRTIANIKHKIIAAILKHCTVTIVISLEFSLSESRRNR